MLWAQNKSSQGSLGVPGKKRRAFLMQAEAVATGMGILCVSALLGSQKNPGTERQEDWVLTSSPPVTLGSKLLNLFGPQFSHLKNDGLD